MAADRLLDALQREAFAYFIHETDPTTGLVADKTADDWPASIAAIGLALTAYPVGVERGLMTRAMATSRTLATLRFFARASRGTGANVTGYMGFYYHFLDMRTGLRARKSELSTVDSALFLAGALTAAAYFNRDEGQEREIRDLAHGLYAEADWAWARNGAVTLTHGWTPEGGFLPYRWMGYDEALILYILALGSETHPIAPEGYTAWSASYEWRRLYDVEFLYAAPLFTHQLSHVWIDFRGIADAPMRERRIDYAENSRRATLVQQRYAMDNPGGFVGYGEHMWGITASDGPGDTTLMMHGAARRFYDYIARGVPDGPDDGTLAPWAVVTSLPFAPEIVLPTIEHLTRRGLRGVHPYGFAGTFNPTFRDGSRNGDGWVSPYHFGINQGPEMAMIENHRSGLVWDLLKKSAPVVRGLRRAGFTGGWLDRSTLK